MKKKLIPLLALCLILTVLLASCGAHGKTLIRAGEENISINVFQLYLSRLKGELSLAGYDVNSASFWNTKVSDDGTTQAEYFTTQVLDSLKQIAAALIYYEELGLSLDKTTRDEIDEYIDTLIEEMGDGSESRFNSILSAYGANATVLRDATLIDAKLMQLKTYLYGEKGELIASNVKEDFYQDNYYRGHQMLLANYYYDHDRDTDGKMIYYTEDGKIAYDTTKGTLTEELDKFGNPVYRNENGKIAYDTKNGNPKYYYDKNGDHKIAYYTEAEMKQRLELANKIAEECHGNEALFLQYAAEWSDNYSSFNEEYAPNGMYFAAGAYTSDTVFYTFSLELAKLEVGDFAVLESSSGYYILMRAPLDKGAWGESANSRWFGSFHTLIMEYMLQKATTEQLAKIQINERLLAGVDITTVAANKYY